MNTDLKLVVDLKAKTAKTVFPLYQWSDLSPENVTAILSAYCKEPFIVEVDGGNIAVNIKFDFGKYIPDTLWAVTSGEFIHEAGDGELDAYWNSLMHEEIRKYISENLLHIVVTKMKKVFGGEAQ